MIKYRILDILIFIGLAYSVSHFTGLEVYKYAVGFFIGYLVFVIGPIVYKIKF